jgi:hypothetical protein
MARSRSAPCGGGDYLIVALDPSVTPPRLDERDDLARLSKSAERITLGDEEHQTINLRALRRD